MLPAFIVELRKMNEYIFILEKLIRIKCSVFVPHTLNIDVAVKTCLEFRQTHKTNFSKVFVCVCPFNKSSDKLVVCEVIIIICGTGT